MPSSDFVDVGKTHFLIYPPDHVTHVLGQQPEILLAFAQGDFHLATDFNFPVESPSPEQHRQDNATKPRHQWHPPRQQGFSLGFNGVDGRFKQVIFDQRNVVLAFPRAIEIRADMQAIRKKASSC